MEELQIPTPGLTLAARAWGPRDAPPVLALHGWQDNAATHDRLAPLLPGLRIVALDLPGHGRSDWLPPGLRYHFIDWVGHVLDAATALGWSRFSLLGHSMGAGVAMFAAAAAPERVERLVMIEGLGPLTAPDSEAPAILRTGWAATARWRDRTPRVYPDLEAAARRQQEVNPWLTLDAARCLAARGTRPAGGGRVFSRDPRVCAPSLHRWTDAQVEAIAGAIEARTLLIMASHGWPIDEGTLLEPRVQRFLDLRLERVEGGHHVHLVHPERVAPLVREHLGGTPARKETGD